MACILTQSFMNDRIFMANGTQLSERRWHQGAWAWFDHGYISSIIGQDHSEIFEIGPLLSNSSEGWARLFIRVDGTFANQPWAENRWFIYTFDPDATNFNSLSQFSVSGQAVQEAKWVYGHSSITAADDQSSLYIYANYANSNGRLFRLDETLEVTKESDLFNVGTRYVTDSTIGGMRPGVMSNHDVFFVARERLYHANIDLGVNKHKVGTAVYGVSPGFHRQVFIVTKKPDIRERELNEGSGKWETHKHGTPMDRKDVQFIHPNSFRQLNDDKVLFLMDPDWGKPRVYERWRDSSGSWHWADHGHNAQDTIVDIGLAKDDTYFVLTSDGRLVQNHWRNDLQRWAWFDHGTP